jgi:hypothetical protein
LSASQWRKCHEIIQLERILGGNASFSEKFRGFSLFGSGFAERHDLFPARYDSMVTTRRAGDHRYAQRSHSLESTAQRSNPHGTFGYHGCALRPWRSRIT